MDRLKADKFLEVGKKDTYICKTKSGTHLVFARAESSDVDRIEKLSDKELLDEWKSMLNMLEYCAVSISDLQIEALLGMEIDSRPHLIERANKIFNQYEKDKLKNAKRYKRG
jgi:hypothetical protein